MRISVITVSDRASRGIYADRSGPAIEEVLRAAIPGCEILREIVPDEKAEILASLERHAGADWILTT